ncbi:MAG: patatin-like phospholipase family protein [Bacteroidota bacterium]
MHTADHEQLGIVLSGGGARGAAHIGALLALEEHNIFPHFVAGTSAGSIVGAMYAHGVRNMEMLRFWEKNNPFTFSNFSFGKPGLIDTDKVEESLIPLLPFLFKQLRRPFYVPATDIVTGKLKIFEEGPLIRAVLASSSFPMVFTPTMVQGHLYLDGGILSNFPVELIRDKVKVLIGINISPLRDMNGVQLDSMFDIAQRAFELSTNNTSQQKLSACDIYLCPPELSQFATFDTDPVERLFEIGYEAMNTQIPALKVLLEEVAS